MYTQTPPSILPLSLFLFWTIANFWQGWANNYYSQVPALQRDISTDWYVITLDVIYPFTGKGHAVCNLHTHDLHITELIIAKLEQGQKSQWLCSYEHGMLCPPWKCGGNVCRTVVQTHYLFRTWPVEHELVATTFINNPEGVGGEGGRVDCKGLQFTVDCTHTLAHTSLISRPVPSLQLRLMHTHNFRIWYLVHSLSSTSPAVQNGQASSAQVCLSLTTAICSPHTLYIINTIKLMQSTVLIGLVCSECIVLGHALVLTLSCTCRLGTL